MAVVLAWLVASQWGAHSIVLRVIDDGGQPVSGANVVVSFDYVDRIVRKGRTNSRGIFRARGRIKPAAFVRVGKDGYYDYVIRGVRKDGEHDLKILLRERKNPIPLIVRDMRLTIPEEDEQIGFDFQVGDWVKPHGKGEVIDLFFEFSREIKGMGKSPEELEEMIDMSRRAAEARNEEWSEEDFRDRAGQWDGKLTIGVPGDAGGFLVDAEGYVPESDLTMPQLAPAGGYETSASINLRHPHSSGSFPPLKTGLFVQTQVEKTMGAVSSAHYAKIVGGIQVSAKHSDFDFVYYFNPRANDRNLEFSTKENLAEDQRRSFPP